VALGEEGLGADVAGEAHQLALPEVHYLVDLLAMRMAHLDVVGELNAAVWARMRLRQYLHVLVVSDLLLLVLLHRDQVMLARRHLQARG
jgi:hypothetical protein